MFLTPAEVREFTGRRRSDAQTRELTRMGVPYVKRSDGSVVVLRAVAEQVKAGIYTAPDYSAPPPADDTDYSGEWRPWRETGIAPCDWMDANWRMFAHAPDVIRSRLMAPDEAPSISGIYFLFEAGELVYIGESVDTGYRLAQHAKDKRFDAVWTFKAPELYRVGVECAYINALRPPLNTRYIGSGLEQLRKEVKRLWGLD